MENMGPILMYEDSILIVMVKRVSRDMISPVNYQNRFVSFLGNFSGNHSTGETSPDN